MLTNNILNGIRTVQNTSTNKIGKFYMESYLLNSFMCKRHQQGTSFCIFKITSLNWNLTLLKIKDLFLNTISIYSYSYIFFRYTFFYIRARKIMLRLECSYFLVNWGSNCSYFVHIFYFQIVLEYIQNHKVSRTSPCVVNCVDEQKTNTI